MASIRSTIELISETNFSCSASSISILERFTKYIIKATELNMNIVDKKIGDIYITKPISGKKIKELSDKITFYARIDTQLGN